MLQSGRLLISAIDLILVCDEVATYRQGTDTRTERLRVFEQPLFRREQIEIEPSQTFEQQGEVEIPADCMHSFKADHNEVQWRLLIRATWLDGRRLNALSRRCLSSVSGRHA